ncbi:ABC transporter permease [Actinomadura macra]|uniref:ABC transporter permease n=1 Tax=Actinomadura macra TaxID=46164 RepID=UPI00082E6264|nr:ABC transporter permease subunit [Actinomadura macra]
MRLIREDIGGRARAALGVAGVVGAGVLAEALVRGGVITAAGVPLPSAVLERAGGLLADGEFLEQVFFTLREWMLGVGIATAVGVVLGGLMGAITRVFVMFEPTVELLRPLPSIAVGPLLVLLLGSGMLPLSLTVAVACLWPILFNTIYGVRAVEAVAVQTARTLHISPLGIIAKIRLPSALPFVFTGVRVAASIGLIVAVSAELLIGNGSGIGGYILVKSTSATNLDLVYAATLVAGLLGVLVSMAFAAIDKLAFGWRKGLAQ